MIEQIGGFLVVVKHESQAISPGLVFGSPSVPLGENRWEPKHRNMLPFAQTSDMLYITTIGSLRSCRDPLVPIQRYLGGIGLLAPAQSRFPEQNNGPSDPSSYLIPRPSEPILRPGWVSGDNGQGW